MDEPRDDSLMSRFEREGARRYRAADAVTVVLLVAILLGLFAGGSVLHSGEQTAGFQGKVVRDVGRPLATVSAQSGLGKLRSEATAFLSPDQSLGSSGGGFAGAAPAAAGGIPSVTPEAFQPTALGGKAPPKQRLRSLLVTGDSMVMPLDADIAQKLVPSGVRVIQDPHIGTGISNSQIVDWGKLAQSQVRKDHPQAVVVFIGANEGWPMAGAGGREMQCCGVEWAAIYAQRVRILADIYRQQAHAHVYWITLPDPREADRETIARAVNAAITVGVQPWVTDVRLLDSVPIFTPHGYRDAMLIGGTQTIVREPDGVHLNAAGSGLLARYLLDDIAQDYTY